ncbi:MAG: DUF3857 domain-containing protein [Acidobacteria bacterium]|nr:DUF3857 domain-containing protein [Acidobacteriota bacterium]
MLQPWLKFCSVSFLLFTFFIPVLAGDDAPPWLRQAAAASTPPYHKDVPAVVLLDENRVAVDEEGKVTRSVFYAVKILTRDGRGLARASEVYETDKGKIKEFRAWLIYPSGNVKKFGKDETADIAFVDNDIYNEARSRVISARDEAEPGAVFGYEAVTESRDFFNQFQWGFQGRLPVVASRYSLTLPSGWRAESLTFNHNKVEPTVSGSSWMWELSNLPPIEPEPSSPEVTNLAPRLAVNVFPAANAKSRSLSFASWPDVSRWASELSDPQIELNDAIAGKARELTANAKTELEKIQAIGRYAQNINYISIQIGIGRFRPHSAIDVFNKSYGDCKDKANLMRAMLKALGITAYPVIIYSGDPTYVREEWPSPTQFNHAIIAVKVGEDVSVPTILTHPKLGRLLVFDPTDENTPVGDLPDHEQGSFALIAAGENGSLQKMPITPPEANKLVREANITLDVQGTITATISERSVGQSAVGERRLFRRLARPDYVKRIEGWITRGATGAKISKVEPADNQRDGRFALDVEFAVPGYAQSMRGQLLVFKPVIVPRRDGLDLTATARRHPLVLDSEAFTETVRVKLPDGFEVDEMPDAAKLETPFGKYSATYEVKDGHLIFTRNLVVQASTIPAAQYPMVREFFGRIRGVEVSPVVLAKK